MPQFAAKVEFEEKRNEEEEDIVLKDIEFYLDKKPEEPKQPTVQDISGMGIGFGYGIDPKNNEPKKDGAVEEEEKNLKDLVEQEKELTNKWVTSLEDTLFKLSGGKINITQMRTNTRDYLFGSSYSPNEQFQYEEEMKDKDHLDPKSKIEKLAKEAEEHYKANSRAMKSRGEMNKHYEFICMRIKLIMYVVDKAVQRKGLGNDDDDSIDNLGLGKPSDDDENLFMESEADQHQSKSQKSVSNEDENNKEEDGDDPDKVNPKKENPDQEPESPASLISEGRKGKKAHNNQLEAFAREKIMEIWKLLGLHQKAEIWVGIFRHTLTTNHRLELWRYMTFNPETFTRFSKCIPDVLKEKSLRTDALGDREIERIWKQIYKTPERFLEQKDIDALKINEDKTSAGGDFASHHRLRVASRIPDFEDDGEDEHMNDMISKGSLKTNVVHIKLIDIILRPDGGKLLSQLSKKKDTIERLKLLKTIKYIKEDPKLLLWLLTPPQMKIELILGTPNNYASVFLMYMLLEEIYHSPMIMMKIEKDLNSDFKNRIYMYFMMYASYEANQTLITHRKERQLKVDNNEILKYVKFLEKQLKNTNTLKAKYKKEIEIHLGAYREAREAKEKEQHIDSEDDSEEAETKFVKNLIHKRRKSILLSNSVLSGN